MSGHFIAIRLVTSITLICRNMPYKALPILGHVVAFLALFLVQGCDVIVLGSMAYSDPVILEGSEDRVSFRAGVKTKPDSFAAEYCQKFGKEPVKLARTADGRWTVKWRYACLPDDPHEIYEAFSPEEKLEIASQLRTNNREGLAKYVRCLAAHEGDSQAQARVASFYRLGIAGYPQDFEKAYLWNSLAGRYSRLEELSASMPSESVERAQRLLFEWEPDPTLCEFEEHATP